MRQVVITKAGPPEVLKVQESPDPEAAAGQVRIRVKAAGINFADLMARLGLYQDAPKIPCVIGYEVAGVVAKVGPSTFGFSVGARVFGMTKSAATATPLSCPLRKLFVCRTKCPSKRARPCQSCT